MNGLKKSVINRLSRFGWLVAILSCSEHHRHSESDPDRYSALTGTLTLLHWISSLLSYLIIYYFFMLAEPSC